MKKIFLLSLFLSVVAFMLDANGRNRGGPEPKYPCKVEKFSGKISYKGKPVKAGTTLSDYTKIVFTARNDIMQIKDADGRFFMVFPQSYGQPGDCKGGGCDPMVMEQRSPK